MAIEPGLNQPFLPGAVLVSDSISSIVGIPDVICGQRLSAQTVERMFPHYADVRCIRHSPDDGLFLMAARSQDQFDGGKFSAHVLDDEVYGWRGSYSVGPLTTYRESPAGAGFIVDTPDKIAAEMLDRAVTVLAQATPYTLTSRKDKQQVTILQWFRRHPVREKNMAIAHDVRASLRNLLPGLFAFVQGIRSAKVVHAYKVLP